MSGQFNSKKPLPHSQGKKAGAAERHLHRAVIPKEDLSASDLTQVKDTEPQDRPDALQIAQITSDTLGEPAPASVATAAASVAPVSGSSELGQTGVAAAPTPAWAQTLQQWGVPIHSEAFKGLLGFASLSYLSSVVMRTADPLPSSTEPRPLPPSPEEPQPEVGRSGGRAIDGYLSNALVWRDTNGNQIWNADEPYTYTDANGAFSGLANGPGAIRVSGLTDALRAQLSDEPSGPSTDISTGKVFAGVLSAPEGATVITPLTTLVVAVGNGPNAAATLAALKTALGIGDVDLANFDPLAAMASGGNAAAALAIQAASIQVASLMTMAVSSLQSGGSTLSVGAIVSSVATSLVSQASSSSSGNLLTNPAVLTATLQSAAASSGISGSALAALNSTLEAASGALASVNNAIKTAVANAGTDLNLGAALGALTSVVAAQLVADDLTQLVKAAAAPNSTTVFNAASATSFSSAVASKVETAKASVKQLVTVPEDQTLLVAVDDSLVIASGGGAWPAQSGNVLSNDVVNKGSMTVELPADAGTLVLQGQYGQLTLLANGSYTYTVTKADVLNTAAAQDNGFAQEKFLYRVKSGSSTDEGELQITLDANKRPDEPTPEPELGFYLQSPLLQLVDYTGSTAYTSATLGTLEQGELRATFSDAANSGAGLDYDTLIDLIKKTPDVQAPFFRLALEEVPEYVQAQDARLSFTVLGRLAEVDVLIRTSLKDDGEKVTDIVVKRDTDLSVTFGGAPFKAVHLKAGDSLGQAYLDSEDQAWLNLHFMSMLKSVTEGGRFGLITLGLIENYLTPGIAYSFNVGFEGFPLFSKSGSSINTLSATTFVEEEPNRAPQFSGVTDHRFDVALALGGDAPLHLADALAKQSIMASDANGDGIHFLVREPEAGDLLYADDTLVDWSDSGNFERFAGASYLKVSAEDFLGLRYQADSEADGGDKVRIEIVLQDGDGAYSAPYAMHIGLYDIELNGARQIAENITVGSGVLLGTISGFSEDTAVSGITLSGDDAGQFQIVKSGSVFQLYFKGASPDYEAQASYTVRINGQAFTIAVLNQIDTLTLANNNVRVTDYNGAGDANQMDMTGRITGNAQDGFQLRYDFQNPGAGFNRDNLLKLLDGDTSTIGIAPVVSFSLASIANIRPGVDGITHPITIEAQIGSEALSGLGVTLRFTTLVQLTETDGQLQITLPEQNQMPVTLLVGDYSLGTLNISNVDDQTLRLVTGENKAPSLDLKITHLLDRALDKTIGLQALDKVNASAATALLGGVLLSTLEGKNVGDLLDLASALTTLDTALLGLEGQRLVTALQEALTLPHILASLNVEQLMPLAEQLVGLSSSEAIAALFKLLTDAVTLPDSLASWGGQSLSDWAARVTGSDLTGASPSQLLQVALGAAAELFPQLTLEQGLNNIRDHVQLPEGLKDVALADIEGLIDLGQLGRIVVGLLDEQDFTLGALVDELRAAADVSAAQSASLAQVMDQVFDLSALPGGLTFTGLLSSLSDGQGTLQPLWGTAMQWVLSDDASLRLTLSVPHELGLTAAGGQIIEDMEFHAALTLDDLFAATGAVDQLANMAGASSDPPNFSLPETPLYLM